MDPQIVSAVVAALGTLGAVSAGWFARKKMAAEADKTRAERDSVIVKSATSAVQLANSQMAALLDEQTRMRKSLDDYRAAVEKATAAELSLRLELGRVKKRVQVLEAYILNHGLALPDETHSE